MYLVILVIDKKDSIKLTNILNSNNIKSTRIASTGGFLNSGNTTLLIGIEEDEISKVLRIAKSTCSKRESYEYVYYPSSYDSYTTGNNNNFIEVEIGGAVAFIIKVEQYFKI